MRNKEEGHGPAEGEAAANRPVPGRSPQSPESLPLPAPTPIPTPSWHHSAIKNADMTTAPFGRKVFNIFYHQCKKTHLP